MRPEAAIGPPNHPRVVAIVIHSLRRDVQLAVDDDRVLLNRRDGRRENRVDDCHGISDFRRRAVEADPSVADDVGEVNDRLAAMLNRGIDFRLQLRRRRSPRE